MGDRSRHNQQNGDRSRRSSYPQYGRQYQAERPNSGQHKRKREDNDEPRDDASRLLASIFRLGDAKPVRLLSFTLSNQDDPESNVHPPSSMQGQDATAKAIQEDIDDQYRLLRRDVQHGRAELVRGITNHSPMQFCSPLPAWSSLIP